MSIVRYMLVLLLPLLVATAGCGRSVSQSLDQGNDAFAKQEYDAALGAYQSAQGEAPDLAEPHYNAANALYRKEQYEEAQKQYQRALLSADADLSQQSHYNQGNSFFNSGQIDAAIESYKEALRLDPDDSEAKHNLELALQRLEEQEQNQRSQRQDQESESQQQQGQEPEQDRQPQERQSGQENQSQKSQRPEEPSQQIQPQDTPITEEQARRILESLGQDSETLQERLHRIFVVPGGPPAQDW